MLIQRTTLLALLYPALTLPCAGQQQPTVETMPAGRYGEDARAKSQQFHERLRASEEAFQRGHLWRARSDLEHPRMIEVYELCKRYPIGLWDRKGRQSK